MIKISITEKYYSNAEEVIYDLNKLPMANGYSDLTYELRLQYEELLDMLPIGTKFTINMSAGTDTYEKVDNHNFDVTIAPWYDIDHLSVYKTADRIASRGNWARGKITLVK